MISYPEDSKSEIQWDRVAAGLPLRTAIQALSMTTDTIESLRQRLTECERERDELATVTQQRDELVMILKWVDKYVSCAISQEIKAALAKLGADKTGE